MLLFLHCKKSIKSVLFHTCSYMNTAVTGHKGGERGMGKVCYLNREPIAKLNINTDPPTEM